MKFEIVSRTFPDQSAAILYALDHVCLTVAGAEARQQAEGEWLVYELVPVGCK